MALGAVGEEFDQRRTLVDPRPLRGPAHRGIDRQRVIAVDPKAGDAIADRAAREGRLLGPGDPGEAGDRPLVVDHRQDDRRLVDRGECHRRVEVTLGRCAVADPAHADPAVALDRAGHRPADRLRILGAEVARDRKEAVLLVRIHDRQLAALHRVALVRINLAHHRLQRIAASDEQALLAIGREVHVLGVHRGGGGDRNRLFPGALHVEAGLALPLGAIHAIIEDADRLHVLQHLAERIGVELRVPRANRLAAIVEHANEVGAERECLFRFRGNVGTRRLAGRRHQNRRKVGCIAGPEGRLGDMQRQRRPIAARTRFIAHRLAA